MYFKKKQWLCGIITLLFSISLVQPVFAISYLPDVTEEMTQAEFWTARQTDAQKILLNPTEIAALNTDIAQTDGTMVVDIRQVADSFDGEAYNQSAWASAAADAAYYAGWTYRPDGTVADEAYYQAIIQNCVDPQAHTNMATRFGVVVNRTLLQVFPSDQPILDDLSDPDCDYQALTAVRVNEPLVLYTTSADRAYYLARSSCYSGWVKATDVAICTNREEWLSAWDFVDTPFLVICENKVYTETSNFAPAVSNRLLSMGTVLELVPESELDELITNRSAFHNYAVYLPVRNADGSYGKEKTLIPQTVQVSEGYLPLTQENIFRLALRCLGAAYGWGGMLDAEDCSGFVKAVYACFGLNLARDTSWQECMPVEKVNLTEMTPEEKMSVLDKLPVGALLYFNYHTMLYLGKVDGKYYVISASGNIAHPITGEYLRTRVIVINTLDEKCLSGKSWLQELTRSIVPFYPESAGQSYGFQQTQWYHDAVAYCLNNHLMSLQEKGTFGLNEPATRADLAVALWNDAGKPTCENPPSLDDVNPDNSNTAAISWAAATGLMPESNGNFTPDASVTREQCIAILYRYVLSVKPITVSDATVLYLFKDYNQISPEVKDAIIWGCTVGLLHGTDSATLAPTAITSRVQLATLLARIHSILHPLG